MIINVASTHRFHLLDIARELSELGHDVRYYSYVPSYRCAQFGIDKKICRCFLWLVWPFFIFEKIIPHAYDEHNWWCRNHIIDWFVGNTMRPCDVFIGLGYVYQFSFIRAKKKWNATTILEWGSKHTIEQLRNFGLLDTYPKWKIKWEQRSYELCDYISLPSLHSRTSFIMHGLPSNKLFVNPYGVDLSQFHPTFCTNEYDLIYVGGWRHEKGSDLLIELCKRYNYSFLHVGSIVNIEFPQIPNMHHVDAVDQRVLETYYAKAKVFVLPSRADGFGMVLIQAAVCGLPIVGSTETGAPDMKSMLDSSPWISIMESLDVESLHCAVDSAMCMADTQKGVRNYLGDNSEILSWKSYAIRYDEWLNIIAHPTIK